MASSSYPNPVVFVSSMIRPLTEVRERIGTSLPAPYECWVYERNLASSEANREYYLGAVRRCALFVLIATDNDSEAVLAELEEACKANRPLLIFVPAGTSQTPAMAVLQRFDCDPKWCPYSTLGDIPELVVGSVLDHTKLLNLRYQNLPDQQANPLERSDFEAAELPQSYEEAQETIRHFRHRNVSGLQYADLMLLGSCFALVDKLDQAKGCFARARKLRPADLRANFHYAACSASLGDLNESSAIFENLLKKHPKDLSVRRGAAYVTFHKKSFFRAKRMLFSLLEDEDFYRPNFDYLFLASVQTDDVQLLSELLQDFNAKMPDGLSRDIHFYLAVQKGEMASANEIASQILIDNPLDVRALIVRHWFSAETGDRVAALYYAELLADSRNDEPYAKVIAASEFRAQGQFEKALKLYKSGLTSEIDVGGPWSDYGNIASKLGLLEEALDAHMTALRIAPLDANFRYNFACSLALAGRDEDCRVELERAIRALPLYGRLAIEDPDFDSVRHLAWFQKMTRDLDL